MKTLILFTTHFPYGENYFLGNEIHHLSQTYERIIIQPRKYKDVEKAELPPNVIVLPPLIEATKLESFSLKSFNFFKVLNLLLSSNSLKGLYNELKGKKDKAKGKSHTLVFKVLIFFV